MTAIGWMLYGLLVGSLLAITARGFEEMCRIAARPTRWVWAGALVLTVVLAMFAPQRATSWSHPAPAVLSGATRVARDIGSEPSIPSPAIEPADIPHTALTQLQSTITAAWQRIPASVNRYVAVLWASLSALALLLLATVYVRFRRVRQGWPVAELHGVRVRIATNGGPAVVGWAHPEVIIPQWLLGRSPEEQRAVLTHECEHVRARDPLVLAVACTAAALLPWHPAVWWMLSRLRLAVELDCDVRVLRHGVAPRLYGVLLIDMAERCSGLPVAAPALADKTSHLHTEAPCHETTPFAIR